MPRSPFGKYFILLCLLAFTPIQARSSDAVFHAPTSGPRVLVLYDGADTQKNPGRLDALYLATLLGHFTTHRTVASLESYRSGQWKDYDAVFCVVFQKKYTIPAAFLNDAPSIARTFCWIGMQADQLNSHSVLASHGIAFEQFTDKIKFNEVFYKNRALPKGDLDTNLYRVIDSNKVRVWATVGSSDHQSFPYVMQSGAFWIFADSPFAYDSENDRYLVLADILHDILGIDHAENHSAILRIEDLNALSQPDQMRDTLQVIKKYKIPFAFGYVPMYINPHERIELHLSEKPEVVTALKSYIAAGGAPVLHGYTHQYRGVTTDDYEFWDDLSDRPVRGDTESFIVKRMEQAISESAALGIFPVTWETPHYVASSLDYRVLKQFFATVFERRSVENMLGTDQFFPYPVIDLYGQYVIPESAGYVPIENPRIEPLLATFNSATVVRDGYASFFFHPFLDSKLLDGLISGAEKSGYHFIDIRDFPNRVQSENIIVSNLSGEGRLRGRGRYLTELTLNSTGETIRKVVSDFSNQGALLRDIQVGKDNTYVALRREVRPPTVFENIVRLAKGDLTVLQRRWETALSGETFPEPVKTVLLWNAKASGDIAVDQESFYNGLLSTGFDVDKVDATSLEQEFGRFTLLVVPSASAKQLSPENLERILRAVKDGMSLVTDGESPLSRALGIELTTPAPVELLTGFLSNAQQTRWPDKPSVPLISSPMDATVYYAESIQGRPLVVGNDYGGGRYLFIAPLFDEKTGLGYARFPNLPQILISEMHVRPLIWRRGADAYFDPGYRQSVSIEVLARMWRRFGIRAIHVAAWHFYDRYSYDYERLIKVAHQNGILVYAWFEWPEVSERFWAQHPNWREKTATLADAHVDWRYLMNLEDPDCFKAVIKDTSNLLSSYDWDGVNIGELTFDSPAGPDKPQTFTPFNTHARAEFRKVGGFDPLELFKPDSPNYWRTNAAALDSFYRYRRDVNIRLLKKFLEAIQKLNKAGEHHFEVIVTMLDALQHPNLKDFLAIDVARTIELTKTFNATLQVEDPQLDWASAPDRYTRMGEIYKKQNLTQPFMIDINVLAVHPAEQRNFATAQPTGIELLNLWKTASEQAPRVCFYSEASIYEHDWEALPYAMSAKASLQRDGDTYIVNAPQTVLLDLGPQAKGLRMDGLPWFCSERGTVIVPAGEHRISAGQPIRRKLFDTTALQTHLLSISGELLGSRAIHRGLEVHYASEHRCLLIFSKAPMKMMIDDKSVKLPVVRGDVGYTVIAPPGEHQLQVITETMGSYLIEATSLMAASIIVLFGLLSSGMLALLFIIIVLNRRLHHFRQLLSRRKKGRV